ncbi:unnamed protein product [Somion occarium]|uniref:General stress protein FMN-binding split barrel domain-containing protein n=1 Tax=Somion occarium TaxID=3059160 RepID=A0ABP1DH81_9APHY
MTSPITQALDPYSTKAKDSGTHAPHEKVKALHDIVKKVKTGMLTTRSSDGSLHARAMAPAGPFSPHQVCLVFIANNASHKFDEIQNDAHVNVSFYDEHSTSWASYSGIARVSQDKAEIEKHWSHLTSAWFGDLGDGVHTGDQTDPRVSIIEVIPDSIRYWVATGSKVGRAANIATSAITGKAAAPGQLSTITKEEIQLLENLDGLNH